MHLSSLGWMTVRIPQKVQVTPLTAAQLQEKNIQVIRQREQNVQPPDVQIPGHMAAGIAVYIPV